MLEFDRVFSEELLELARKAVEAREKAAEEDIDLWANRLLEDVINADD